MNKIRELRINAGLTQLQLADKCEVERSTIGMIEGGHNKPSFELAIRLAKALNCSVDDLID